MRTVADPNYNSAGVVEKYIGTAYDHVKNVSENMKGIKELSLNMDSVSSVAGSLSAIQILQDNPEFLVWLEANKGWLDDLSDALRLLKENVVASKQLEGTIGLLNQRVRVAHGLPSGAKITSIVGTVVLENGTVYPINTVEGITYWADGIYVYVQAARQAEHVFGKTFYIDVGYKE